MKKHSLIMLAAATAMAAAMLCSCGGKTANEGLTVLDLEAAIDNRRTFDLAEISADIDFIPLDDSQKEGLVGNVRSITATKERFYVRDNGQEVVFKVFDSQGRFLSTLGRIGRGPGEFQYASWDVSDYDGGILYVSGRTGDMKSSVMAFDASGRRIAGNDSIPIARMVFHNDKLILIRNSPSVPFEPDPDYKSSVGTKIPFLEIYSPDLKWEQVVEVVDKGSGEIVNSSPGMIMVGSAASSVLSDNGNSLIVKEARSDTVFHYRDATLEPAYRLAFGKYTIPADAFGLNPSVEPGDSYGVRNMYESDGYIFIEASKMSMDITQNRINVNLKLVFDRRDPSGGFSATGGADGNPGFFLDGLAFTPMYIRDNRLVGYMQALDIVDNAENLTNPDLKALAATLKEDSNPVIVIATLK